MKSYVMRTIKHIVITISHTIFQKQTRIVCKSQILNNLEDNVNVKMTIHCREKQHGSRSHTVNYHRSYPY